MVNAPAGSTGDRVAVANCVSGPKDLEDWIISLFEPLPGLLAGSAGHRETWLLAVRHHGPDCCCISLTVWDHIEDYRRQEGDGFAAVFGSAGADWERSGRLNPMQRYDLEALPLPDLGALILARVGEDYPGVRVSSAALCGLSWSASQTAPLRESLPGGPVAGRRAGLRAMTGARSGAGAA